MSQVIIKEATIADAQVILTLIKELAEYEQLADQVVATVETIKESIFVQKKANVVLLWVDQQAVGLLVYFENFSTFIGEAGYYLEDLYVKATYRKKQYGYALLEWLVKRAYAHHIKRVEWSVLDWNQPAINFYQSLQAKPLDQWTTYRLDQQAIAQVALKKSVLE